VSLRRTSDHGVRGHIDVPAAGSELASGLVEVSGWAFDEAGPVEAAALVTGHGLATPLRLGRWREDVASAFPAVAHAGASGFEVVVDLREAGAAATVRIALLLRATGRGWQEVAAVEVTTAVRPAPGGGSRARAAFTMVQNEPVMLPVWLDHYGRYFNPDDLYVLDHDSTDGSTSGLEGRCRVVPVHRRASFEHRWMREVVESFQRFLLSSYEAVLFAEADELVVADPRLYAGLDDYIERLERPAARCAGFNVVHSPEEPPLRFDQPLLAQRRYWHASQTYSKRLLARMPLRWSVGFHDEYDAPDDPPDPALMLVHLHRVDRDAYLARHRSTAGRNWSADDIRLGLGVQNRLSDQDELEEWFRAGPDLDAPRELIPEHIRSLL
jgi:hypothetical protein